MEEQVERGVWPIPLRLGVLEICDHVDVLSNGRWRARSDVEILTVVRDKFFVSFSRVMISPATNLLSKTRTRRRLPGLTIFSDRTKLPGAA